MLTKENLMYRINAPAYRVNRQKRELLPIGQDCYSDGILEAVQEQIVTVTDDCDHKIEKVCYHWKNISDQTVSLQLMVEAETTFHPTHYVIPCVMYNGNQWGSGKEPKGLCNNGTEWVFSYERTGIPACTLSENNDIAFAMFASPKEEEMKACACSMGFNEDGTMHHRVIFPIVEEPETYHLRDRYCDAVEQEICLFPGESYTTVVYLWTARPMWPCFGMAALEDAFLDCFPQESLPCRTADEVWSLGVAYAHRLSIPYDDHRLFVIGLQPNRSGEQFVEGAIHFEFGWCGQNGIYSRMLIHDFIKNGNQKSLELALSCLDAYAEKAISPCGLMYVHYESQYTKEFPVADTCNLGFAIMEFAKSYRLLQSIGISRPGYLRAAERISEFLLSHWSKEYGFGKAWDVKRGTLIDGFGTIGAYVVPGLVELYRTTKDAAYLAGAERALKFYYERDLANFFCTAGALDTRCIDKETSGALVMGGILLYEETGKREYLEIAKKAAYYFCSWMFHYNVLYAEESDFSVLGFHTLGGTSVSAQHHHIDPWGGLLVPWFVKLAKYTGNRRWTQRARLMWNHVIQLISDEAQPEIHGLKRPIGAQNEGFLHCHWGTAAAGRVNDWLVAWPGAFRLNAIAEMEDSTFF